MKYKDFCFGEKGNNGSSGLGIFPTKEEEEDEDENTKTKCLENLGRRQVRHFKKGKKLIQFHIF